ncbi:MULTISPECIES: hypothetical protein [Pseudarthrobacter]|uniref:hypothetical protein n=1 Tax=Pseudarthrobacter TaxID=1742993 RepID=UPI0012F717F4|nr:MULTISPECIES: hypothetical protein [Pseudarthrobacter]MUU71467.1 hypothetical protein [Pseudarthrobacter sp. GA104]WPU09526.1 hypothetical protein SMD14_00500 [Pseudarthrobacter oxydans]
MSLREKWADQERERQAANEERVRVREAERAKEAYKNSPVGLAETAYQNGDQFFQVEMEVSSLAGSHSSFGSSENRLVQAASTAVTLGQIEALGWHLEHAGYVFVETGSTSTNRVLATGQGVVTKGHVAGIYLFRRAGQKKI